MDYRFEYPPVFIKKRDPHGQLLITLHLHNGNAIPVATNGLRSCDYKNMITRCQIISWHSL